MSPKTETTINILIFRRMDTVAKEANPSIMFLPSLSIEGIYKFFPFTLDPFRLGLSVQENKQEVLKVVPLQNKMVEKF